MNNRLNKLKKELIERIEQFADAAMQEATDNAVALDICRERIKELEKENKILIGAAKAKGVKRAVGNKG